MRRTEPLEFGRQRILVPKHIGTVLLIGAAAFMFGVWPARSLSAAEVSAIREARIVTGTGKIIAKGTVVFRKGLITDVGEEVKIPADAQVVEGAGLTIYPGLIDAYTQLGMPSASPAGSGTQGSAPTPALTLPQPEQVRGDPSLAAADLVKPGGSSIEEERGTGVTTALTCPRQGVFPGQSALINLAGSEVSRVVVRSPVFLTIQFTTGSGFVGVYPNSLMGTVAFIRQSFYDAIHYREENDRYHRMKRGIPRPEYDRKLATLGLAIHGDLPVAFIANTDGDIRRALMIADEFKLRPIIIGGLQSYRLVDILKTRNVPVILSMDFPKRAKDLPEDEDEPIRVLRERAEAPKAAGLLARAGLKFALMSGTLSAQDFMSNIQKAIEGGLTKEDALRAMTSSAAEILRTDDQLGTIEAGKIANLVVTGGDLFTKDVKVRYLFIDGNEIELKKPETPAQKTGKEGEKTPTTASASSAAGQDVSQEPKAAAQASPASIPPKPPASSPGPSSEMLIRNGTILTASHGTISNGSILVRHGKIVAVGTDVKARDPEARIIDATGKFVTPGIIDVHSHTAISGDVNENTLSVTSMVRIQDVINPYSPSIYNELAGGLTTVNTLHGSANAIGGQNAVLKLKLGKPVGEWFVVGAPPSIKMALGENPRRSYLPAIPGQPRRYPATRMGVEETIRDAFIRAKDYQREWKEYEAKKISDENAIPPRRDLALDAIVEILEGKRLIHAHSYRQDEILMLLNLGDEIGFHVQTLDHVLEGYKVAKEIAGHHTAATTFSDVWSYKMEAYDAIPFNAAFMTSRGVNVSLHSDGDEPARRLYLEAAKLMKYGGMTEEQALRAITLNSAMQIGIENRAGSIDVGKDADLVIFSQHPFSVYTVPEMTIIEGEIYFDRKADLEKREALKHEKDELIKREREQREVEKKATPPAETKTGEPQPPPKRNVELIGW